MGSYQLIITDFRERYCDVEKCTRIANQYRVTVTNDQAIVEKYCYKHQNTKTQESQS